MVLTCCVHNCSSNETTEIDGRKISFYPFPTKNKIKKEWEDNYRHMSSEPLDDIKSLRICEKHFSKDNFADDNQLNPDAIPTIFNTPKKRKIQEVSSSPNKNNAQRMKLNCTSPSEQSTSSQTPNSNSSVLQNVSTTMASLNEIIIKNDSVTNGVILSNVVTPLNPETGPFRLRIQIDKVYSKPCPKSQKKNQAKQIKQMLRLSDNFSDQPEQEKSQPQFRRPKPRSCSVKGKCDLENIIMDDKPTFHCTKCKKYFTYKSHKNANENISRCLMCKKTFSSVGKLYNHIKEHLTCSVCLLECKTLATYEKHTILHHTLIRSFPFKCHLCPTIFEDLAKVRKHMTVKHKTSNPKHKPQSQSSTSPESLYILYQCKSCNISFRNEMSFKRHTDWHTTRNSLKAQKAPVTKVESPVQSVPAQIGHLRPVIFSCRVCSKEFTSIAEIDTHTKTHMDVSPTGKSTELQCSICNKLLETQEHLDKHMRNHLSRAHRCPKCPKTFINKISLNVHLKSHQ